MEAERIFDEFLTKDSLYELNIHHQSIKTVEVMMQQDHYVSYMFDDIQKQIEYLIKDTLMRFIESNPFEKYEHQPTVSTPRSGPIPSIVDLGNFFSSLLHKNSSPRMNKNEPIKPPSIPSTPRGSMSNVSNGPSTKRKGSYPINMRTFEKHPDLVANSDRIPKMMSPKDFSQRKNSVSEESIPTTSDSIGIVGFLKKRLSLGNAFDKHVYEQKEESKGMEKSTTSTKHSLGQIWSNLKNKIGTRSIQKDDDILSDIGSVSTDSELASERTFSLDELEDIPTTSKRGGMRIIPVPQFEELEKFKF